MRLLRSRSYKDSKAAHLALGLALGSSEMFPFEPEEPLQTFMFTGRIPEWHRRIFWAMQPALIGRDIFVGCSGAFTFESILTTLTTGPASVHSNDVSLVSCMLGRYVTGRPLDFDIIDPDVKDLFAGLSSGEEKIGALFALLGLLQFRKRNNHYTRRMWAAHVERFQATVGATVEKLKAWQPKVDSFFEGDVGEHFRNAPADALLVAFVPTYDKGYEKLYKSLDEAVRWDAPDYVIIDEARRKELFDSVLDRGGIWFSDQELDAPKLAEVRSGRTRTTRLYSRIEEKKWFVLDRPGTNRPFPFTLASPEDVINNGDEIRLAQISTSDLLSLKDRFLGKNVNFASGTWAFAVVIQGKCWGFFEYQSGTYDVNSVYLMADFPIASKAVGRLSKLIVSCAISKEAKTMLERLRMVKTTTLATTAFTDRPVSMKYRGVLKLTKRGRTSDGQAFLNYGGQFTDQSCQTILKTWLAQSRKN